MGSDESWRDQFRRFVGLVIFVAMVGGFTLSSAGTPRYDWTILTWLGYPEYNMPAFFLGVAGLVALVAYGYFLSRYEE